MRNGCLIGAHYAAFSGGAMVIGERDREIVQWAIRRAYPFEYCRPNGLPEPCLRVRLGLSRAYFHRGRLVHWSAESAGGDLDQLMYEMFALFAMCTTNGAYASARAAVTPPTAVAFDRA